MSQKIVLNAVSCDAFTKCAAGIALCQPYDDSLRPPGSDRVSPEGRSLTRVESMKQVCRVCVKIFLGRKSLLVHEILSLIQVSQ